MARESSPDGGAFRVVAEALMTDASPRTFVFGPYDKKTTARRVRSHKTNPDHFDEYTSSWSRRRDGVKVVSVEAHIETATAWKRVTE